VKGSAAASQIVSLTGRRGAEQPAAWILVARDTSFPGRFRAYTVSGGRITAEVALPASESAAYASTPLDRTKLKVDSPVVFWRAHTEAEKAGGPQSLSERRGRCGHGITSVESRVGADARGRRC
jgi:hypothetical protein